MLYVTGRPLDPKEGDEIYGREDIVSKLTNILSYAKENKYQDIAVVGIRRIGKSTILLALKNELKKIDLIPVYVDYTQILPRTLGNFANKIFDESLDAYRESTHDALTLKTIKTTLIEGIKKIVEAVKIDVSVGEYISLRLAYERGEREEQEIFTKMFDALSALQKKSSKVFVIMIDEFGEFAKDYGKEVLDFLRSRIQVHRGFVYVISGSTSLYNVIADKKSLFFGLFQVERVKGLSEKDATNLLVKPAKKCSLVYEKNAVKKIISKIDGHPYYLQWMGKNCVTMLGLKQQKIISEAIVEEAYDYGLENDSEYLRYMYEILPEQERNVLTIMAKHDVKRPVNIAKKIKAKTSSVVDALTRLKDKEYVIKEKKGEYVLIDSILKDWIKRR